MITKDTTVETKFHPMLTAFLFRANILYVGWGSELIITSGSEFITKHSRTSLHYSGQAADIRIWEIAGVPAPPIQLSKLKTIAADFCIKESIPADWIDIVLEKDHLHCEYQPKSLVPA